MADTPQSRRKNPFPGPRAFKEQEPLYGRDREARQLLDLLISQRIVLLYSPSGAGKTSLIQAKILPGMRDEGYQVLPVSRPGILLDSDGEDTNPLAANLIRDCEEGRPEAEPDMKVATRDIPVYLGQRRWIQRDERLKLLVLDQFEELLTNPKVSAEQREEFCEQLGIALANKSFWLLVSMREEFSPLLDELRHLLPTRLEARFRLGLLTPAVARLAGDDPHTGRPLKGPISGPAHDQGVVFEEKAINALVDELAKVADWDADGRPVKRPVDFIEPLHLQVVCHRIWSRLPADSDRIDEAVVSPKGLDALAAEVDSALMSYYAKVVHKASKRFELRQRLLRQWLQDELITPQHQRKQVLIGSERAFGIPDGVVARLSRRALLRPERHGGSDWVEIAHDRLVDAILKDNEAWFERNLQVFQVAAMHWDTLHGCGKEGTARALLLGGGALHAAEDWARRHPSDLMERDNRFLEASRAAWNARKQRQRLKRVATIGTLVGLVVVVALGVLVWMKNQEVVQGEAALKNSQIKLATQRQQLLEKDYQLQEEQEKLKAQEAQLNRQETELETEKGKLVIRELLSESARSLWREDHHELAVRQAVRSLQLSKDQQLSLGAWPASMLRTALGAIPFAYGGQLRLTDAKKKADPVLDPGDISLSPTYHHIAVRVDDQDKDVLVIPPQSPGDKQAIQVGQQVIGMRFSPDDRYLALITKAGVGLVEVGATPPPVPESIPRWLTLPPDAELTGALCFSADGQRLAVAERDGSVVVTHTDGAASPGARYPQPGTWPPSSGATALACAPDGAWVARGDNDGTVVLLALDEASSPGGWRLPAETSRWPKEDKDRLVGRKEGLDLSVVDLGLLTDEDLLVATYRVGPPRIITVARAGARPAAAYVRVSNRAALDAAGALKGEIDPGQDPSRTLAAGLSPSSRRLAAGGTGGVVGYWDLTAVDSTQVRRTAASDSKDDAHVLPAPWHRLRGLKSTVRAMRFIKPRIANGVEDSDWVMAIDVASNVRWWSLEGALSPVYVRHADPQREAVRGLAFVGKRGERLAVGATAASTWLGVDRSQMHVRPISVPPLPKEVRSLTYAGDADLLLFAVGQKDKRREPGGYSRIQSILPDDEAAPRMLPGTDHNDGQWTASASPDGRLLLTAGWDGKIVVWESQADGDPAEAVPTSLPGPNGEPGLGVPVLSADLFVSSDGGRIDVVAGTRDGSIHLWRRDGAGDFRYLRRLHKRSVPVRALAYTPKGRFLLAGDDEGLIWQWHLGEQAADYPQQASFAPVHTGIIYDIAVSRGEHWGIATAGGDGKAKFYPPWLVGKDKIAFTGRQRKWIFDFEGATRELLSVALSQDNALLAAGDAGGNVHLWYVDADSPESAGQALIERACREMPARLMPQAPSVNTRDLRKLACDGTPLQERQ
jgi:WD40 repeat protein/flagellar biosynthesis GTPase FlhF